MNAAYRVLLSVLAAAVAGCAGPPADNLLFVSFDTTWTDHLSAYGYPEPTSPAVESLVARGAVFERAFTHVPSTLPAHSSMFTGGCPPLMGYGATASSTSPRST